MGEGGEGDAADGAALPPPGGDASQANYEGELVAVLLFFRRARAAAEAAAQAGKRAWALITTDCQAVAEDCRWALHSGGARGWAGKLKQATMHEVIAHDRARIFELGGFADMLREPGHAGSAGNAICDAAAKAVRLLEPCEAAGQRWALDILCFERGDEKQLLALVRTAHRCSRRLRELV